MHTLFKRLSLLCAAPALLACGTLFGTPDAPLASAEESYLLGRSSHLAWRPHQALAYYQAALRAEPSHVHARNGLAALHAEQGRLDEAIALWEPLARASTSAHYAYLLVNLGQAYLLRGEARRAQEMLEQACVLDPANPKAWEQLGAALSKLGQRKRGAAMLRQAVTLRGHDIRSDYAVAGAAAKARPASDGWARTEISLSPGGIYVLSRIEADGTAALAAAPDSFPGNVLFEISNGNGVTGMARQVSRELGQGGAVRVRLSNQKGFAVKHTRVEYKAAFKDEAAVLAARYGASRLQQVGPSVRADVRLVLGRDLRQAGKEVAGKPAGRPDAS